MNTPRCSPFLALVLVVAACSAPSQQHVPLPAQDIVVTRPDLARIYCVRDDSTGLRRNDIEISDGETQIGVLAPGTFLCWERAGGRTLGRGFYGAVDPSLGKLDGIVDFDCPSGSAYYYLVGVRREDGKPVFSPLKPDEGKALVAKRRWAGKS